MKRVVAGLILCSSSLSLAQEARDPKDPNEVALYVNNQPVTRGALETVRRSNPIFNLKLDGAVGQDLENLLMDQTVFLEAAAQDAAGLAISDAELERAMLEFRKAQWLERDETFSRWLTQTGWTEQSLRSSIRSRLLIGKRIETVRAEARVQAGDLEAFFAASRASLAQAGKLEDRVLARAIVVNDLEAVKRVQEALKRGQDFATLAQKFSLAGAARGGAVNTDGGAAPKPVTRSAFPAPVASAAFRLADGGLTPAVRDGANVYIVKVIRLLPTSQQPLSMQPQGLRQQLERDILALKQEQGLEAWLDRVRSASVQVAEESDLEFFNPVVASVGGIAIHLADVNRIVYFDPQVSKLLLAATRGSSGLVPQYFKTRALQTLLDEATAAQAAKNIIGPRSRVLEVALRDATKGVRVTDGEAQDHYWAHIREFIVPAGAKLLEANFKTQPAAEVFRTNLLRAKGESFGAIATKHGGTAKELGRLTSTQADPAYANAFTLEGTTKASRSLRVSQIIEHSGAYKVLLVQGLTPSKTPRFREVRDLVTTRALEEKRAQAARTWLDAQRQKLGSTNRWLEVSNELEARAKAKTSPAQPASEAPAAEPVPTEPIIPSSEPTPPPSEPAPNPPAVEPPR